MHIGHSNLLFSDLVSIFVALLSVIIGNDNVILLIIPITGQANLYLGSLNYAKNFKFWQARTLLPFLWIRLSFRRFYFGSEVSSLTLSRISFRILLESSFHWINLRLLWFIQRQQHHIIYSSLFLHYSCFFLFYDLTFKNIVDTSKV